MADGANRRFLKERKNFLKNNIIEVQVRGSELIKVSAGQTDATKVGLAATGRVANKDVASSIEAAGVYEFDLFKSPEKGEMPGLLWDSKVDIYQLKEWGMKRRDGAFTPTPGTNTFTVAYTAPAKANPIRAYWVPWSSGSCWSVQLGAAADFFFTPTMDGCSLAISSGLNPIVTHGNYKRKSDAGKASESRTLRKIDQHHAALGTDRAKTLAKNTYAMPGAQKTLGWNFLVTVIGFRNPATGVWEFCYQRRKTFTTTGVGGAANAGANRVIMQDRLVSL